MILKSTVTFKKRFSLSGKISYDHMSVMNTVLFGMSRTQTRIKGITKKISFFHFENELEGSFFCAYGLRSL
jgi:hypothetical protein